MSEWAKAILGEICSVNPRFDRAQRPDAETPFSFVPMAAVDEVAGVIVAPEVRPYRSVAKGYTAFRDGDVLFAKITPCMENGKSAIAENLVGGLGFGSTEFHVLRPGPRLDRNFLFHMVRLPEFRRQAKAQFTGTAGQQRVPTTFLQNFTLPLPPLEEQRRIVDILDRAASIRRLRRQAQETACQIVPALFNKMFGDPGTNPMGWPVRPLGEIIAGFEGGRNLQADAESGADGMLRILKVSAVTSGRFRPEEAKPAPPGYVPPDHHFVRDGDLLISRANTAELVGATAMVRNPRPTLLLPDKIWRILWRDPSPVTPDFLLAWFKQPAVRTAMSRCLWNQCQYAEHFAGKAFDSQHNLTAHGCTASFRRTERLPRTACNGSGDGSGCRRHAYCLPPGTFSGLIGNDPALSF